MKILIIDENGVTREFLPKEFIAKTVEQKREALKKESEILKSEDKKNDLKVYSMAQLSELLATSRPTIYRWIDRGLLKQVSIGGRKYFRREDVEQMLENGLSS